MPYTFKKQGDQYAVYKKDTGKLVGKTKGTKEALRRYLAALHINAESFSPQIKLSSLITLTESEEKPKMSSEQKKAFLEAVYRFAEHSNSIYRTHSLMETSKYLGELIEAAGHLTLAETEDWFDSMTVSRHMKNLSESHKIFEKTAKEISNLQQRLESAYEDIGTTLNKYYDVSGMVSEAVSSKEDASSKMKPDGKDYQNFFSKAMKKFKIQNPGDLESEKQKKKFFGWVDKNYTSKAEKAVQSKPKPAPVKEEPPKKTPHERY
jgi:hypothetical protein